MTCDEARELLSEYLRGGLDHGLLSSFKDHLSVCGECKADAVMLEKTWDMLDELPMLDPPADFRHDVVVQAARLKFQRDDLVKPRGALLSVIDLFVPDRQRRGVAAAIAAAIVLAFCLKLPQTAVSHFAGGIETAIHPAENSQAVGKGTPTSMDHKSGWLARRIARNTLWVGVDRRMGGNGKMLCSINLAVNPEAFLPDVGTRRIDVKMHLMQNDSSANMHQGEPIWQGTIEKDTPLVVPVILDRTDGSAELLISWKYGSREYSQVAFIPSSDATVPDSGARAGIGACNSMYSFMDAVAQEYGVPVVAGLTVCRRNASIEPQNGTLKEVLGSVLTQAGMDWLLSDGVVYIDNSLEAE